MQLVKKFKIFPTKEQLDVLWTLSENCRLIYNFALTERMETYANTGKSIGYIKQQNDLPKIKKHYPRYQQVHSKLLQMTLRTLDADYCSFIALKKNGDVNVRPPKYKGKKHLITLKYNQSGFRLDDGVILLSHFINDIPLEFDMPLKFHHILQVEIFKHNGQFWIAVIYDKEVPEYIDNKLYQAWDLGIKKQTGVNIEGKFIEVKNPRPDKYWRKSITGIQSRRDHCIKGSRKWIYLNFLKRKCEKKQANQLKDFQHKFTTKAVNNTKANTIVFGDLSVKKMAQSEKATPWMNRATQGTGFLGRIASFLTYKCEKVGKKGIENDEYQTTKRCCCCGELHDMPVWKRVMKCDCGNILDRDRNSTVNIMLDFLSQNALWTSYRQFVGNLRNTGLNIVSAHSQKVQRISGGQFTNGASRGM